MGIDRKKLQILRLRVSYKDGTDYIFETAIPCIGSAEQIHSISAEGIGEPVRLGGEWAYENITREMMDDLK
jgi:hypothetical protein